MAIELSNLTFTEQDDIVPASGEAPILNTSMANTLDGNDRITGRGIGNDGDGTYEYGFKNVSVLNIDDGNDTITGILAYGRSGDGGYNIVNSGTLNTGEGNDIIDGNYINGGSFARYSGIYNSGMLNAGGGDDTIAAFGTDNGFMNEEAGTLNTGEGNDIIIAIGYSIAISNWSGATINTGNGDDSIISVGGFYNHGGLFLGDGNDTITSGSILYNGGVIETGNGDDSIVVNGGIDYYGPHMALRTTGMQLIWVMVTTPSLLMEVLSQSKAVPLILVMVKTLLFPREIFITMAGCF